MTPVTDALNAQGAIQPGTEGWWKVWGATLNDVRDGDLVMIGTRSPDGGKAIHEHLALIFHPG
jgi:hypothetical protein